MRKTKYLFTLMLVGLLALTGCGKKSSGVSTSKSNGIKDVASLIDVKYDEIDNEGDYFYALSGDSLTGTITFFNKSGKKLGDVNLSKMDPKIVATLDVEELTDKYYILSYKDVNSFDYVYAAYSYNGKKLIEASDIEALTDNYLLVTTQTENDSIDSIYSSNGKEAYKNVESARDYENAYIYFKQNDVSKIIDNNGKEILSGYRISEIVKDDNDKIKYMIIRSDEDSVYNYYDVNSNTKKGDAFTNYTKDSKTGNMIITKKVNSNSVKFVLSDNGEQTEYKDESSNTKSNYYEEIKDKIDMTKYAVFADTVKSETQNYILVNSLEDNKYGVLDIAKGEFTELGTYKENSSRRLNLQQLSSEENNNDVIFSVTCSTYYCDYTQNTIYNFTTNKMVASRGENETGIYNIYMYDNGYKVIENSSSSNEDSRLYILLDNEDKKLLESKNYIDVLGQKIVYYTSSPKTTGSIALYNVNDKKIVNADGKDVYIVTSINIADKKLRYFNPNDKISFITDDGKINSIEGKYQSYDDTGLYLVKDKTLIYYNAYTDKTSSYTLVDNESNNGSNGREMTPYRDVFFINNSYDMTFRVVNADGKNIISKKDAQIYKLSKDDNGNVLIYVKDKNDKIGIYIAK